MTEKERKMIQKIRETGRRVVPEGGHVWLEGWKLNMAVSPQLYTLDEWAARSFTPYYKEWFIII